MSNETITRLYAICEGLNNRFPGNRDPFRFLARLMEECGEELESSIGTHYRMVIEEGLVVPEEGG